MKNLLFIFLSCNTMLLFGMEKRPSLPLYTIVSDKEDQTIKKGFCIVEGYVVDQSGKKIQGALVSTVSHKRQTRTDGNGFYTLKLTYKDSSIYMFHEKYGEIVVPNYDFKSQHRVVIHFNPEDPSGPNQTVKKPVIYLYSAEPTNVSVVLSHAGMTFMYPGYENGWNIETSDSGTLKDISTKKEYPYLFWEAKTEGLKYQSSSNDVEGFLIATDTVVSFLENALKQLGLNSKEQTDFITFWAPQLIAQPFVLIQFLVDETYESEIAPIAVNPTPDSQRRLFMLYTPLSSMEEVSYTILPQQLAPFNRSGLTLIEWGGAEIDLEIADAH
jgi:hypothetical protein